MLNHRYHHALPNVRGNHACWGSAKRYSFAPQVLEPSWHLMHDRLQTARSIDEVLTFNRTFTIDTLGEYFYS
jgi:hypothetical protein